MKLRVFDPGAAGVWELVPRSRSEGGIESAPPTNVHFCTCRVGFYEACVQGKKTKQILKNLIRTSAPITLNNKVPLLFFPRFR